jgi:lipid-A-disaccharide synthase-like uncharacterized protein
LCLGVAVVTAAAASGAEPRAAPPGGVEEGTVAGVTVQLAGSEERVRLQRLPDGSLRFLLTRHDGSVEALTPEAFARRVYHEEAGRSWWLLLLNITSPLGLAWVAVGLAGQVLFAGRMVVQWVASERSRRSVVPAAFWWMSLAGASMLIVYFVWRRDVVGVLGQATGWIIYLRNLSLILGSRRAPVLPGSA